MIIKANLDGQEREFETLSINMIEPRGATHYVGNGGEE